jgi:hypothetical protein
MQNGHVESFHARLRDECLNASWFRTLNDVRSTLASWRREYNCERPHSSLDYRTPEELRLTAPLGPIYPYLALGSASVDRSIGPAWNRLPVRLQVDLMFSPPSVNIVQA